MNMLTKFEALPFPEIIGGIQKLGSPWMRPRSYFCIILMDFCSDGHCECIGQICSPYSFIRSWDSSDWSFGWGCEPQSLGTGGRRGSGMVPYEKSLVTSYRLSIVTFPLSLRVSEILPLLFSSTPLLPTPPLVSPNFPMFPVSRWMIFRLRRAKMLG